MCVLVCAALPRIPELYGARYGTSRPELYWPSDAAFVERFLDPALVAAAFRDEVRAAAARGDVEHVVFAMGDSGAGRRNAALFREVFGLPAHG